MPTKKPKEANPEVPDRLPKNVAEVSEGKEQRELREALEFQVKNHSELWDAFISSIVNKDFESESLEDDLGWLVDRLQKTKMENDGLDSGGWRRMMVDMASDRIIGGMIDGCNKSVVLGQVQGSDLHPKFEELLRGLSHGDQAIYDRLKFLEQLLDATEFQLNIPKEIRDKKQQIFNVSMWSDILARFKQIRVEACRERFRQLVPEINQKKQELTAYYKERYADLVSPEGLQRLADVKVWLADEYLESGAGWTTVGEYYENGEQSSIEIAGRVSIDRDRFNITLGHEFEHVISGHGSGQDEPQADKEHIHSRRRIGIGQQEWLDEAITETLNQRRDNIPEDKLSYFDERRVWQMVQEKHNIQERDMLEWHFVEGDDTAVKEKLDTKYPGLFATFERIKQARKGGKRFENVKTNDDVRALARAVYGDQEVTE